MPTNEVTGNTGETDLQREERIRKANPFLDERGIQKLIQDEKSRNTAILNARTLFR